MTIFHALFSFFCTLFSFLYKFGIICRYYKIRKQLNLNCHSDPENSGEESKRCFDCFNMTSL